MFLGCVVLLLAGRPVTVRAQALFQNRDVEAAIASGYNPGFVPAGNAIPGWAADAGGE